MDFYVYILFSPTHSKHYIGYSNDPASRLISHNTSSKNSFTSKYRPWELMAEIYVGNSEKTAINLERYIKKRKSKQFNLLCIEKQKDDDFIKWLIDKANL